MPFDPCGMKVRAGTHCYTTKFKPFRDSSLEVDLVWYPALPTARVLPFPTFVVDLQDDVLEQSLGIYQGRAVGEVPGAPRPYNHQGTKPGTGTGRFCGTAEMFRNGAYYDPDVHIDRRDDGLPVCCGPGPPVGLYVYAPPGFSTGVLRGSFWVPGETPLPRWYDVAGLTPSPARLQHDYPSLSKTWTATFPGTPSRFALAKNITGWAIPGSWVLDYFSPSSTFVGEYQAAVWDGIGSKTFGLTSGSGPATVTVTLVT